MDIYRFCYEIQYISSLIGSIELVNIHTKFEVNQRKFYFSYNYDILVNLSYLYLFVVLKYLKNTILTIMVLKYMKYIRKTVMVLK